MQLPAGDKFIACQVEMTMGPCVTCGFGGYRILVVRSASGENRKVTLCAQHFADACTQYPEVRELERFRLDPGSKPADMRPAICCPRCGGQLDLGEHGSYKIILATGVTCNHCHAQLVIEHNKARQEKSDGRELSGQDE